MRSFIAILFTVLGILSCSAQVVGELKNDTLSENFITYRTRNSLTIVPVMINDSIKVNLILDPHCKTVILFGKRYYKLLKRTSKKNRENIDHDSGFVSYYNRIRMGPFRGGNISILIVPNSNPLNFFTSVNGIIGTEFLSSFELFFDPKKQIMTFRKAESSFIPLTTVRETGKKEDSHEVFK